MGLTLSIEAVADRLQVDPDDLGRAIAPELDGTIEVVLADPGYMRVLNRRFRHVDRPTDVLTFDLSEPGDEEPDGVIYVDARLCPPMESLLERIFRGFLHLRGRTHDDEADAEAMASDVAGMVARCREASA